MFVNTISLTVEKELYDNTFRQPFRHWTLPFNDISSASLSGYSDRVVQKCSSCNVDRLSCNVSDYCQSPYVIPSFSLCCFYYCKYDVQHYYSYHNLTGISKALQFC